MLSKTTQLSPALAGDFWSQEQFDAASWRSLSAFSEAAGCTHVEKLVENFVSSTGLPSGRTPERFVWRFGSDFSGIVSGKVRMRWEKTPRPFALKNGRRSLYAGSGFTLGADYLEFPIHPAEFFGQDWCEVEAESNPTNSFNLISNHASSSALSNWTKAARHSISPGAARTAAAWSAGLAVTPRAGKLLGFSELSSGALYVFDSFNLEVPYEHTRLEQLADYPAGHVVCDDFEVRHITSKDYQWWSDYPELEAGIPLRTISPWDLFVPAEFTLTIDEEGPPHSAIRVLGEEDEIAAYWINNTVAEFLTDKWLVDLYEASAGEARVLSAFDFLFGNRAPLVDRIILVVTGVGVPDAEKRRIYNYFHQERLLGTVVLFINRRENFVGTVVQGEDYWLLLEDSSLPDIVS